MRQLSWQFIVAISAVPCASLIWTWANFYSHVPQRDGLAILLLGGPIYALWAYAYSQWRMDRQQDVSEAKGLRDEA